MSRLWNIGICKATVVAMSLLLAACQAEQPQVTYTPLKKSTQKAVEADVVATPPAMPSLEFEWDTEFSHVISPPADIRKAATASCQVRGFDLSYMISVALNDGIVRALFGCRGPN